MSSSAPQRRQQLRKPALEIANASRRVREETALEEHRQNWGVEIGRVLDSPFSARPCRLGFRTSIGTRSSRTRHGFARRTMIRKAAILPCRCTAGSFGSAEYNVLIETCFGNDKSRPGLAEGHMLDTRYLERLVELGCPPMMSTMCCARISTSTMSDGTPGWKTGVGFPTFPNARYVFSRTEYEAAKKDALNQPRRLFSGPRSRTPSIPVVEAGKACLVEGVHELVDHLTLRPRPATPLAIFASNSGLKGRLASSPATCCTRRSRFLYGNGAPACAGTNAWRRLRVANCLNSALPRTRYCCPAISKLPMSGASNGRQGRSRSTSDGSFPAAAPLKASARRIDDKPQGC